MPTRVLRRCPAPKSAGTGSQTAMKGVAGASQDCAVCAAMKKDLLRKKRKKKAPIASGLLQ